MRERFSVPVQTGPGVHPASYTKGTSFLTGVNRPERDALITHPYLAPRLKKQWSYTHLSLHARLRRILQSMQHTQGDTKERELLKCVVAVKDRLCGLVVGVTDYRYRGLGFDSRRYQIF